MKIRPFILPLVLALFSAIPGVCADSPADLNGDGSVDGTDLLLFTQQWMHSEPVSATGTQVGWETDLLGGSAHGVSGQAVVTSATSVRLENFDFLNNGPDFYVYLIIASGTGDYTRDEGIAGQSIFKFTNNASEPYVNDTLNLTFPEGVTIAPYTHLAIWCNQVKFAFGSGRFAPPAMKRSR